MGHAGGDDVEELTLQPEGVGRSRRPRALWWGVLAAVALATGALVVTAADEDGGGSRPDLPVALGSASGGRDEAATAADSMLAYVTYVAGDDLPVLGGEAAAYRLTGAVDESQVRALADALGVTGDITHEGSSWSVGAEGGSLEVYEGAGGQWWYGSYSDKGAGSVGSTGSASSSGSAGENFECPESTDSMKIICDYVRDVPECPDGGHCSVPLPAPVDPAPGIDCEMAEECATEPPAPAADLPSEDEARGIALDLLAAAGVDVEGADVTLEGPFEAWYVNVAPRVDGLPTDLLASVTVGPNGEVTSASGYLGTPERLGDYPVLDTRAAIDRANAQAELGTYGDRLEDRAVAVGTDEAVASGDCKVQPDGSEICEPIDPDVCAHVEDSGDEPAVAPETTECIPVPGVPPETVPEPEPVEITLVDAEPSLVMLGAIDGSTDAYLVPGYRFTDADGGVVSLPAVADEALTEPPSTETTLPEGPMIPDPGGTSPADPEPCREVLVEEDPSGTTHTVQPHPDCVDPTAPDETVPASTVPAPGTTDTTEPASG